MSLNIVRVLALPAVLLANTIYMVSVSATELQVVTVGNSAADVRSTILTSTVDGKLSALNTALSGSIADAIQTAAGDASTKSAAAQAAAIAAASQDATFKADAAEADAIAAAAADATTKANAAQAAAAADATTKSDAAQAAAIAAAAQDATTKANAAEANAKTYADGVVSSAIGNLDLSNSAQLVADIAARDALELTKNSFVLVSDATGDATVGTGAALYFYTLTTDSFLKIAEYESLDVVIPNKAILEAFSDVNDQLYYKGLPVATVQAGASEW